MKSKNAIIKAWWNSVKDTEFKGLSFKDKDIKEEYIEQHGNILGECACCKKLSHDKHGQQHCIKDWVARGFTSDYADNKNKITFCSIKCAESVGVEFTIRPLLKKTKN
ncbi:MAG: hypothetical protein Unbinned4098contig1000_23 [Prokaryotic dsDNA virus sp.]|nr:MAG: hypothetical protein Unbinned4098contig1000_23 [Prokaryotic dsDNA virus sp.]|tara:strand:- start:3974 stop:4297 length:324 start_codon:yes stop_codon:yes gene_type:complete